jgi:hypothetical protein
MGRWFPPTKPTPWANVVIVTQEEVEEPYNSDFVASNRETGHG